MAQQNRKQKYEDWTDDGIYQNLWPIFSQI